MIELTPELKAIRLEMIRKSACKLSVRKDKAKRLLIDSVVDGEIILTKEEQELCGIIL